MTHELILFSQDSRRVDVLTKETQISAQYNFPESLMSESMLPTEFSNIIFEN